MAGPAVAVSAGPITCALLVTGFVVCRDVRVSPDGPLFAPNLPDSVSFQDSVLSAFIECSGEVPLCYVVTAQLPFVRLADMVMAFGIDAPSTGLFVQGLLGSQVSEAAAIDFTHVAVTNGSFAYQCILFESRKVACWRFGQFFVGVPNINDAIQVTAGVVDPDLGLSVVVFLGQNGLVQCVWPPNFGTFDSLPGACVHIDMRGNQFVCVQVDGSVLL